MKIGVVTFPGSLDDHDAMRAVELAGGTAEQLWHADATVRDVDAVILPGGFSYGDYLRCGAVAHRAVVMEAVSAFARDGGPVLGICNGFQVLCESGLLPGALLRNAGLRFVCRPVALEVVNRDTPWTRGFVDGGLVTVPVKNGEGRFYADVATIDELEGEGRIVFRYAAGDNPNGSERDIAGICNEGGNVVGLMPHPEHAVDATLWGGADALPMFTGLMGMPVA
jgi:phosphoribosylformylglycinamidine synthase subunit PurQ / glutaminase